MWQFYKNRLNLFKTFTNFLGFFEMNKTIKVPKNNLKNIKVRDHENYLLQMSES